MESVAHSRQRNKVGITLSNNNGTLSGKSLYDDVYGGPPKFGVSNLSPRFEDYSEIFGSFHTARASSIPVLDLPAVHETEAFFDPRSDTFNYTDVFCALDFAVSYENLFHQHCGLDGVSYEEAWTPAETGSFSGESDHSANNQSMLNGDVFHSIDGNTEFNISDHKASGTSNEHKSKGKTHMTQLHAVPDFSRVYDETTKLHQTDPSFQVANDIEHDMEFSAGKVKGNHLRKTMPCLRNVTSGEQTFDSDIHLQNGCSRNDSRSSEMFVTVSDISLRSMPSQVPPPSRPPPVLDAKKGDIHRFHSNSRLVASEETPSGAGSPPFFDVEDDMNLSDTASADAMKEAMLRAEAKLRSAKQLKERKKGVYERHAKSSDEKINEAKMCKDTTGLNSLNDETMQESCARQKLRKASPETLDILEGKRVLNMIKEKNKTESRSSPESDRSTGVGTQKEESEFFELVGMEESGMVIEPTKQSNILVQGTGTEKHGQKESEASNVQEKHKKVKAAEENYWGQEYEKNSKAAKEACEHNENIIKSKASNEKWRQTEYMEKEKMVEVFELEENEKSIRMVHKHGNSEKKVTEVDQSGILEDMCEMGHKEHKEVEIQKPKEVDRQTPNGVQSVKRHRQYEKTKENGKMQTEAFAPGQTGDEKKLNDSVELGDIDQRSNVAFELDNNTQEKETCRRENEIKLKLANQIQINKELKEAHEKVEIEKTSWGSSEDEVSDEGLMPAFGRDENEKQHKEGFELEVNEITLKEAFMQRENEAYEQDQSRKKFEYICDGYGEGNRHQEAGDNKGVQKVLNQTPEKEQFDGMLNEAHGKKVTESTSNRTFSMEGNVTVSNKNSHLKQSKHTGKYVGEMKRNEGLDKTLDGMGRNEKGENIKIAKATDATWEIESDEDLAAKSASIYEEIVGKVKVSKESVADHEIGKIRTECKVGEKKLKELGVENQLANEKIRVPEMTTRDVECSGTQSEKVDDDTMTKDDYRRSMEAVEPASLQETVNVQKTPQRFCVGQSTESKEKIINETPATVVKDDEKMRRERESGKVHLGKIEEERDREREREKDRMAVDKAMLEADREREREKDRIAVDGATFEARDRAYDEACERAERAAFERATVEARHKALAEARERLEKACAEARDKSYIHKATTEARLKAERAAVERATAEAQERAMEKLKNERTAYESRERLERSVSDNFGVCFRDGGRQDSSSSDPQFQNFSSSTGSRHPYSLYGAASFSERSEREGESAQRCRARLERHRRTAERAAKALAEKNMRDLLVQKEQAERNRLAETLDAEVRRWSSGKEGNLRALLSTLQYILGPDSGWQPIPLTEVITSAAVKKAYRKATLCVHPDKLQQRGASIQHKYICEKVFDLLKEAWNKFNSEER